jgi:hypothetical protein
MKTITLKKLAVLCGCAALMLNLVAAAFAQTKGADKFDDVKYLKTADKKKAEEVNAELEINKETGDLLVTVIKGEPIKISKSQITNLVYERTSRPRYVSGLLLAWPLLFTKGKKHFLTIQYKSAEKGEFVILHLDKNNYQPILASAEAATGVKVEKMID